MWRIPQEMDISPLQSTEWHRWVVKHPPIIKRLILGLVTLSLIYFCSVWILRHFIFTSRRNLSRLVAKHLSIIPRIILSMLTLSLACFGSVWIRLLLFSSDFRGNLKRLIGRLAMGRLTSTNHFTSNVGRARFVFGLSWFRLQRKSIRLICRLPMGR